MPFYKYMQQSNGSWRPGWGIYKTVHFQIGPIRIWREPKKILDRPPRSNRFRPVLATAEGCPMMHFLFPVLLGRVNWNRHIHQSEILRLMDWFKKSVENFVGDFSSVFRSRQNLIGPIWKWTVLYLGGSEAGAERVEGQGPVIFAIKQSVKTKKNKITSWP